jgi:hypothetical protein
MKDIAMAFFHHGHNGDNVIVFDLSAPPSDCYNDCTALSTDTMNIKEQVRNHAD